MHIDIKKNSSDEYNSYTNWTATQLITCQQASKIFPDFLTLPTPKSTIHNLNFEIKFHLLSLLYKH